MERVRWLLEKGADPVAVGRAGSAVSYAELRGVEMKKVVEEGVAARRWIRDQSSEENPPIY